MAGPRLTALRAQFDELKKGIDTINRTAKDAGRDLTEQEQIDVDKMFDRVEALKPEITKFTDAETTMSELGEVFARVNGATPIPAVLDRTREPVALSVGEYMVAAFEALRSGDTTEFIDRCGQYFDRAQQITTDTLGIIPTPIVGDVIKLNDATRPVFNSFTSRPMPAKGRKFDRPRISQRAAIAEQLVEFAAVASQKMVIVPDEVTKRTFAGYLDLSQQDVDWTDPAALDLVIADFIDLYAEVSEGIACGFLTAAATVNSPYTATNVQTLVTSYVDAVLASYNASKRNPDRIWVDIASAAALAKTLSTNSERSALSILTETLGEMGINAKFIVAPQLAPNTRIVGPSSLIESYEQRNGLLRAAMPSVLGQQIAYYAYLAFYSPAVAGFVKVFT